MASEAPPTPRKEGEGEYDETATATTPPSPLRDLPRDLWFLVFDRLDARSSCTLAASGDDHLRHLVRDYWASIGERHPRYAEALAFAVICRNAALLRRMLPKSNGRARARTDGGASSELPRDPAGDDHHYGARAAAGGDGRLAAMQDKRYGYIKAQLA